MPLDLSERAPYEVLKSGQRLLKSVEGQCGGFNPIETTPLADVSW